MSHRPVLAGAILGLTMVGAAVASDPELVRVRLVADSSRFEKGEMLHLGAVLDIEPGWHVYWKNPGDSGLATELQLSVPGGFEVGPVLWPLPERFIQPGDLTGYGYHGQLLLAAEVRVPESLPPAIRLEIAATVSWLACKEKCVLGSVELREPMPPSPEAVVEARPLFEAWREALPEPADAVERPFTVSVVGGLEPGARSGRVSLWLEWAEPPGSVDWFPEGGEHLKVSDPVVRTRGALTRIDAGITVFSSGGPSDRSLRSLVVVTDPDGGRRGWELQSPIGQS